MSITLHLPRPGGNDDPNEESDRDDDDWDVPPCSKILSCGHNCTKSKNHKGTCTPCKELVFGKCDRDPSHRFRKMCHETTECMETCGYRMKCEHACFKRCNEICARHCKNPECEEFVKNMDRAKAL